MPGLPYVVSLDVSRTLSGVFIQNPEALLLIPPGSTLRLGDFFGAGRIEVHDGSPTIGSSALIFAAGAVVDGEVWLNDFDATPDAFVLAGPHSAALMLGSNGVITGQGRISSPVIGGTIRGGAGELDMFVPITDAFIEAGPDAVFAMSSATVITDSTIRGLLRIRPSDGLTLGANVVIEDAIAVSDGVDTRFVTRLIIADDAVLDGEVRLNGSSSVNAQVGTSAGGPLSLGANGAITGQGRIESPVDGGGMLAPGLGPDGIGFLDHTGFNLGETSHIAIDARGIAPTGYDRLDGSGVVRLTGSLDVDFVDGYVPNPRDQFEIISATTVDGFFRETTIEPVGMIGPAHIFYTGDSVLVVVCAADRDADGVLTVFDFLVFQNQFDRGDLRADLDGDGELTIFDFLVFQNRFAAGCG